MCMIDFSIPLVFLSIFFFNDTATTEIYTLSLHDALPISRCRKQQDRIGRGQTIAPRFLEDRSVAHQDLHAGVDRKSTRLNSSHITISYAVFCLKKKKKKHKKYHNETQSEKENIGPVEPER